MVITIGMLHHRKDPNTVIKSYAYASVAKAEGADFFFFSPKKVDFENKTINGLVLENGQWIEKVKPFPDVIYNAGSPEKLAKSKTIINNLKKIIPFTTNSIGNKWNVNERLKEAKEFAPYLIPSEILKDIDAFYKFITNYQRVVMKPIDGRKGQGIYFIEKKENGYHVSQNCDSNYYSSVELTELIKTHLKRETYIIQPYISSKTKSGQAFDFRLHAQKNGQGQWVVSAIYPRIAPVGSIISNINNGGYTNYLEPFLKQEFPDCYFDIKRTLEHFTLSLARHLDDLQVMHYKETIDELGIDIGFDENKKIWIYEINWRPGCPPIFYLELDVVRNTIQYAMYLAKKQSKGISEKGPVPTIAVTGSAGKTTTKAFIASILRTKWNIFESKDYCNTTEHTLKHKEQIDSSYDAVVLEYGMAYPGVISNHCELIKPTIGVITNVGLAHVGNFESDIRGVAQAKSELIHGMDQEGILVVNNDDQNSQLLETEHFNGKILTIGIQKDADFQAYDIAYVKNGMSFKVAIKGQSLDFFIPIFGEHNVYNALNAIAVGDNLGFSPLEIKNGLMSFSKPARRMTVYTLKKEMTVIDDTVHANPVAVKAAIDVLCQLAKKRKIAVLGRMPELGDLLEEKYRDVGKYVAEKDIDFLCTYGYRADEIGKGAIAAGFAEDKIRHFTVFQRKEFHQLMLELLQEGDTVLFKGASRLNLHDSVRFLRQTFR